MLTQQQPASRLMAGVAFTLSFALASCSSSSSSSVAAGEGNSNQTGSSVIVLQIPPDQQQPLFVDDAKVFDVDTPYLENLVDCAQRSFDSACTLAELPMMGQDVLQPSIDDIMNRVVVTHDWTAVRFRQILESAPANVLGLFKPVTSIYIGSDNDDTSYSFSRGRLAIDINDLWINIEEKSAVAPSDSDGGDSEDDGLVFTPKRRTLIGDEFVYQGSGDDFRDFSTITLPFFGEMYWSLAYANNLVPATAFASLQSTQTVGEVIDMNESMHLSELLYADTTLTTDNSYLYIAARAYAGDETLVPDGFIETVNAVTAGAELESQGKVRLWSYRNRRVDFATLFQTAMFRMNHRVYVDDGLVDKHEGFDILGCDDEVVGWGMRNRIASPLVAARARFVLENILGQTAEVEQFFASGIGTATIMPVGAGWCESKNLLTPLD